MGLAAEDSGIAKVSMRRYRRDSVYEPAVDEVAREEPLEIQVRYWTKDVAHTEPVAVAMRSPGQDAELAAGYLFCEGILESARDIQSIQSTETEILVELSPEADVPDLTLRRRALMNSACGLCGKTDLASLPQISKRSDRDESAAFAVPREVLYRLPELLRSYQGNFQRTGGLHAAAFVDREGRVDRLFEDIGRHNALDKLIGNYLLGDGLPLAWGTIAMSSRGSFELVQKALASGAHVLATVGAPSNLAVEAARAFDLTLIGFVREDRFNTYAGEGRIGD